MEGYGDDIPFFSLLILLIYISKFNIYDTPIEIDLMTPAAAGPVSLSLTRFSIDAMDTLGFIARADCGIACPDSATQACLRGWSEGSDCEVE